MNALPLFAMLLGHLVGDYLVQTDYQARNKTKSSRACFNHSFWYTIVVGNSLIWIGGGFHQVTFLLIMLLFASHYPIDRYSVGKLWCEKVKGMTVDNPIAVFVCIMVDNTIHISLMTAIIFLTF